MFTKIFNKIYKVERKLFQAMSVTKNKIYKSFKPKKNKTMDFNHAINTDEVLEQLNQQYNTIIQQQAANAQAAATAMFQTAVIFGEATTQQTDNNAFVTLAHQPVDQHPVVTQENLIRARIVPRLIRPEPCYKYKIGDVVIGNFDCEPIGHKGDRWYIIDLVNEYDNAACYRCVNITLFPDFDPEISPSRQGASHFNLMETDLRKPIQRNLPGWF